MDKNNGNHVALHNNLQSLSLIFAFIVTLGAIVVLIGWYTGITVLTSFIPRYDPMRFNTALCFMLSGISLILLNIRYSVIKFLNFSFLNLIIRVLSFVIVTIALLTFFEYLLNINLKIDQLFYNIKAQQLATIYTNHMPLNTVFGFLLFGLSLLFATFAADKSKFISQIFAVLVGFIVLVSFMGYITGETVFASFIEGNVIIALNSLILFSFAVLSLFLVEPDKGIIAVFLRRSSGGILLRNLLPAYIFLVFLIVAIIVLGINVTLYTPVFAVIFFAFVKIIIVAIIIYFLAKKIDSVDIDLLTMLRNRNSMQQIMQQEINRCERYKTNLSVLFLDIDNFKKFNDEYGHKEGDNILIKLAEVIAKQLRVTDYAFRFGGEEFLILLPTTTLTGAFKIAERIRTKFNAIKFYPQKQKNHVHATISIGVADCNAECSVKSLINLADKAMYQAKQKGKNQTCIFNEKL